MKIKFVKDSYEGAKYLKKTLYDLVDRKTALFLSGGKTPKETYSELAFEKKISPGVAAMIDERYGKPMHDKSNEKMLEDSGLLNYFKNKNIPFYNILQKNLDLENTAIQYDQKLRVLFSNFPKRVGILGIGEDGHVAGLPSGISNFLPRLSSRRAPSSAPISNDEGLAIDINNFPGEFKERISLTFKALEKMDLLIVIVFGLAKQNALKLMFGKGSVEEIPARFFTKPKISKKTILITDQKI